MEKIKTLSIDLETFSDVDLSKCGVYKYVESPAFEILLGGSAYSTAKSSAEPYLRLGTGRELVKSGNYTAMELLYDDIPDTLSQLIRTAFVPKSGTKFVVSDFSAIEARVLSWLAGVTV